jgi:hypothetical protein
MEVALARYGLCLRNQYNEGGGAVRTAPLPFCTPSSERVAELDGVPRLELRERDHVAPIRRVRRAGLQHLGWRAIAMK